MPSTPPFSMRPGPSSTISSVSDRKERTAAALNGDTRRRTDTFITAAARFSARTRISAVDYAYSVTAGSSRRHFPHRSPTPSRARRGRPPTHPAEPIRDLRRYPNNVRTAESIEQVRQWIRQWRSAWSSGNGQWAVTSNGEVAGRIGFRQSDLTEGVTELAYWTLPARRGHSIAPRAANMLTRWAFHDVGFDRIELTHSVHNLPSCRVAAKCGFLFEGTLRGAGRHSDGRHDMHLHARLRTD
ncbi:GNAT family N-acetyltransferase [Nocardia sp. NPDC055002]